MPPITPAQYASEAALAAEEAKLAFQEAQDTTDIIPEVYVNACCAAASKANAAAAKCASDHVYGPEASASAMTASNYCQKAIAFLAGLRRHKSLGPS